MINIYALYDPREPEKLRYVGKTKMILRKRLQAHIDEAKGSGKSYKKRTHKINWINSLLVQGIKPEIKLVEECLEEEWESKEKYFIKKYRELFPLTNTHEGGYSGNGLPQSIIQYSVDGVFIKVFNSIEEACLELNVDRGLINSALQRKNLGGYGGGYLWRYYINKYPQYIEPYFEKKTIIRIKDLVTSECRVFLTLKEGLEFFKIKRCGAVNEAIKKKIPYKHRYSMIEIS